MGSTNVDLRDGFATTFFNAEVVVVGDPVQYHLVPDGQKTVRILAKEILSGKLKDNFSLEEEYLLDNGVKAKVFLKIKPINQEQIIYLADEFGKLYPKHPALFRDRILSYLKILG